MLSGQPFLLAGSAQAQPVLAAPAAEHGPAAFSFLYSREQIRPKGALDNIQREVIDGGAWLHLTRPVSLWLRARGSSPWGDEESGWSLTDLEFGPYGSLGRKWGRVDLEGWLGVSAPAGDEPLAPVWFEGMHEWSLGAGGRATARILGGPASTPIALGFDLHYRGSGQSGWIYFPHHSVAMADPGNGVSGDVLTWQARLEIRGDRARLSSAVLWEEPIGAGDLMAVRERPFYLIQRAAFKVWRHTSLMVAGEILLSGDDPKTSFKAADLIPRWSASAGVGWEYPP